MKIKTLQQVKDYVAQLVGYSNWDSISYTEIADFERASLIDDVANHYANEVAKKTKEKCDKAFRAVITAVALGQACGKPINVETEYRKIMDNI